MRIILIFILMTTRGQSLKIMGHFVSVSAAAILTAAGSGAHAQTDTGDIDEIIVYGTASQVELTGEYAGGQVARGGRAGLLGNLDYLDAPFSGTAFTHEIIQAQQSDSVGDVLLNDPVVRVTNGFGNFQEVYIIRGFPVFSDDITLNGLYGILPRQFVAAEFLERVEVFRGANAFINGAAPGGSGSGGAVNLVSKRAPEEGLRRLSLGYENAGQFYAAADLGQRFGPDGEWGARFNAVFRDGETSIEDQDRELAAFSLGTDYAGERFRFSADIGYQDNRINNPRPQVTPLGEAPEPPDAGVNYAQPGTFTDEEQVFGVVRAEFDVTDIITVWAAGGARSGEETNLLANPNAAADGSTTAFRFDNVREDRILSADAGARAEFFTGPVGHNLVVSASIIDTDSKNAFAFSNFFSPFPGDLNNPTPLDELPPVDFFTGGDLNDPMTTEEVTNQSIAFADTLALFDGRVLLTGGLRYQAIEMRSFDATTGLETSGYDEDAITPVGGLVFKATDQISLYANYAEGLQPGATAPASTTEQPIDNPLEVLDPFRGEQIEFGGKVDLGSFGATLSLFSVSRQNAIIADELFQASGEQRNRGVELSFFGEPAKGVRLIGGMSYIDAELRETQGGVNEGNTAIGVPEVQANLNAEWDIPFLPGLTIDGRVIYTGEQFINEANTLDIDAWARLDIGLRYATEIASVPVAVRARLDNVTDNAYWASSGGFPGANYLIQGDPRTFSLRVSADF